MNNHNRDLLVLLKTDVWSQQAFEEQIACLHKILVQVECSEAFCTAHELVTRFKITSKRKAVLDAASQPRLKPFHFLININ